MNEIQEQLEFLNGIRHMTADELVEKFGYQFSDQLVREMIATLEDNLNPGRYNGS